ncbi:hypothetical protein VNI00_003996 [Paramarasmius palmivorus]|uniref:Alpha/beta hydrolase fold-3 domain-containing protein n=1 Tax=Paramarasmius palmivorus TaxID=297713 RepID=A0AAW0DPF8_9AGAR
MAYEYRWQPAKTLYLTLQVLFTLFIRIPIWMMVAIPRQVELFARFMTSDNVLPLFRIWRPTPSRSYVRTLLIQTIRQVVKIMNKTGPLTHEPNYRNLEESEDAEGVWVDPTPELITGDLKLWALVAAVQPARIPGYIYHRKSRGSKDIEAAPYSITSPGKIILSFHGGSYTTGTAHPRGSYAAICRALLEETDSSVKYVFALEYRVSSAHPLEPLNPFPAALIDALAGYNYLVNVRGITASDIIIEGDSAGGNLAYALTRYLVEQRGLSGLPPPPGGLLLFSPYCDVGLSHDHPRFQSVERGILQADYVPAHHGMDYPKEAFIGPHGMGAADINSYISPASMHKMMKVDFHGFPKTFICAGEYEILISQIRLLRDRMLRDLGTTTVTYHEGQDETHDYLILPWKEPARYETLEHVTHWIKSL